ncbi:MAG TPA: 3-dehydroquinate synthase, partial [Phycisphaerales bacterium]|nr:3-dehydroquinate synthase [Phycisphaerales bacterium]
LARAGELYDRALEARMDRHGVIVALGGGVVGDLAGFVAATYLRGVRLLQVPTSLLAMVDSSVGGKTAVNLPRGKNLAGVFHQPEAVAVDLDTLLTLPAREYVSGLAEVVKYAVIRDRGFLEELERGTVALVARDAGVLQAVVARCCRIKAAVVGKDERESGLRAILNYGHTLGHAIETVGGYGALLHGEAVALGMTAANHIAVSRGMLDAAAAGRVRAALERLGLPTRHDALDADEIWRIMQHDKKNVGGKVRMILARALGRVDIFDDIAPDEVRQAVASLR